MSTTLELKFDKLRVMDNQQNAFGDWLTRQMEFRNLTNARLAHKVGVTRSAISNYTSGGRIPNQEVMLALAEVLDQSPETLYRIAGILPEPNESDMTPAQDLLLQLSMQLDETDLDDLITLAQAKVERQRGKTNAKAQSKVVNPSNGGNGGG